MRTLSAALQLQYDLFHIELPHSSRPQAYYEPVKDRPNLHVITGARATRLILKQSSGGGKIAVTGVEYVKEDQPLFLEASREVILCAGKYLAIQKF
jgi:choline dehydrogenase